MNNCGFVCCVRYDSLRNVATASGIARSASDASVAATLLPSAACMGQQMDISALSALTVPTMDPAQLLQLLHARVCDCPLDWIGDPTGDCSLCGQIS